MPTGEEPREDTAADRPSQPTRPLMTRSLTAASDPARRLQELLREQTSGDEPAPILAAPAPEPPPIAPPSPAPPAPVAEALRLEPPVIAAPVAPAPTTEEIIRLSITLDGARLAAVDYPGPEALPTRAELEQTHHAYVLRDQWSRTNSTRTWTVHMRRKTR